MSEKSRAGSSLFSCLIVLRLSPRDLLGIRWESNNPLRPLQCLLTRRDLEAAEPL